MTLCVLSARQLESALALPTHKPAPCGLLELAPPAALALPTHKPARALDGPGGFVARSARLRPAARVRSAPASRAPLAAFVAFFVSQAHAGEPQTQLPASPLLLLVWPRRSEPAPIGRPTRLEVCGSIYSTSRLHCHKPGRCDP